MLPSPLKLLALLFVVAACGADTPRDSTWSDSEIRLLQSLTLSRLPPAPPAVSNRVADEPRAARFGESLFFDTRLSGNNELSCASCHRPELYFTDGLPRGTGIDETARNTPGLIGGAWQTWFYWDGRRDSLWSQALVPIEAPDEMGGSRTATVRLVLADPDYRNAYESLFGAIAQPLAAFPLPEHAGPLADAQGKAAWERLPGDLRQQVNEVYANVGKAIAAFERTLVPGETAFDRYVAALAEHGDAAASEHMSEAAIAGLRLFIDGERTQCLQCHNGPLLSNGGFHNIGSGNFSGERLDYGRLFGAQSVTMDEFNCLGRFSDADAHECNALRFLSRDTHQPLAGAFKVPTLRNAAATAPYLHDGRFDELIQVMRHYNAPPAGGGDGAHELRPLGLTEAQLQQLVAFLHALTEPPRPPVPAGRDAASWTDSERALLATLSLARQPPARPDPGNRFYADDGAAALGEALFFDTGLSRDGTIACASCHRPERAFTDGRPAARGLGDLARNTISLIGVAHNRWFYWDGRKDSLWSQALEPIEAPAEMGGDRLSAARYVLEDAALGALYARTFGASPPIDWGALPRHAGPLGTDDARRAWRELRPADKHAINGVFANIGKSIAAYERRLTLQSTRFDAWLDALLSGDERNARLLLSRREIAGLRLFISGSTMCVTCHNGPRFTDDQFHNIGTGPSGAMASDPGRQAGRDRLAADKFNCASPFGDDYPEADCTHLQTMMGAEVPAMLNGAFRTPGLRNLERTAPFMHDGRFATLEDTLRHYADPPAPTPVRHELSALSHLGEDQIDELAAFLRALSAPAPAD